jgi:hypothetical protein
MTKQAYDSFDLRSSCETYMNQLLPLSSSSAAGLDHRVEEPVPFVFVTSDILVSAWTLSRYCLLPAGVALIPSSPGFQFAGQTYVAVSIHKCYGAYNPSRLRRIGGTYLAILIRELKRINEPKRLIHRSPHRKVVDSNLPDNPMWIDQEQPSQRDTLLLNQHAVVFRDTVVLVAQQRDVDLAQPTVLFACVGPRKQAILAICACEDNAGATGCEIGGAFTKRDDFGRADESPGHGDEAEDEPLLGGRVGC